jgi:hypothetical protein
VGSADAPSTLAQRLASGRLPLGDAMAMLDSLCEVVGEAHREGAVIGEIQPAAVTWDGIRARLVAAGPRPLEFQSPQQLEGRPPDARADVFALGVIGYLTIAGADPFGAQSDAASRLAAIEKGPTDPRTYLPKLSERVDRTLLIALARNLTERFADALTMRAALRGDSDVALDSPTLRWAVPEGIPEGDTGAADEYADSQELVGDHDDRGGEAAASPRPGGPAEGAEGPGGGGSAG